MVIILKSEDPHPMQLQHRETQRASLELRFPVQIKSRQWLSGLQTLLDDEQEDALQKGTGQEYGNLDATSMS